MTLSIVPMTGTLDRMT